MSSNPAAVTRRVIAWVLAGQSRDWIAARLGLDPVAVDGHLDAGLRRLIPAADLRRTTGTLTPRPRALRQLRDLWESRCAGARVPPFSAFTFRALQPWAASMAVLEPAPDGADMFIRLAGRDLKAIHNRELDGQWLGRIVPPAARAAILRPSQRAFLLAEPQYERRCLEQGGRGAVLHRQALPCARDGARPEIILVQVLYEPGAESHDTMAPLAAALGR